MRKKSLSLEIKNKHLYIYESIRKTPSKCEISKNK